MGPREIVYYWSGLAPVENGIILFARNCGRNVAHKLQSLIGFYYMIRVFPLLFWIFEPCSTMVSYKTTIMYNTVPL